MTETSKTLKTSIPEQTKMHADSQDRDDRDAEPAAIDLKVLDQYREIDPAGGQGLAQRILRIYRDSSRETLRQAEQAAAAGDAAALRQAAHSLKSSSASIGAIHLSGLFRELEAVARAARLEEVGPLIGAARGEYERVLVALRNLLAEAA